MSRWRLSASDAAWLTGQAVLFLVAFVLLPAVDGGPGALDSAWLGPVGTAVMAVGAVIAAWAMAVLGRNLVPQPTPVEDGTIVMKGPYGFVRHPIYLGVLLLILGALLRVASPAGLLVAIVSVAFFDAKSRHEDRLLQQAHPEDHAELVAQTRSRLFPGLR